MATSRAETWGRLMYCPDRDDFVAEMRSTTAEVRVNRPISAGCLITAQCNLRCGFCYGNLECLPRTQLSAPEWAVLFRHMREDWGLMRVDLSGGEPTLRSDCAAIANAATDLGLNVVLSTNGIPLHRTGLSGFPRSLGVHVSLDSGFEAVHERSRLLPTLDASSQSFRKTSDFIKRCLDDGLRVRVLTCIGHHNCDGLFALASHLAELDVPEWNISHILPAGRAQANYASRWSVPESRVLEQVDDIRCAFPWMTVRYSNRTDQDGYFLMVLPDGSLATQYTDARDKVVLGDARCLTLAQLQACSQFNLSKHTAKWIAAELERQPDYAFN